MKSPVLSRAKAACILIQAILAYIMEGYFYYFLIVFRHALTMVSDHVVTIHKYYSFLCELMYSRLHSEKLVV